MQKKIDKIRMKGMKKKLGALFLKMRPPDFFWADPSLSLPQKGSIFMANWESSYGADLLQ
jgi:hypothetical protein